MRLNSELMRCDARRCGPPGPSCPLCPSCPSCPPCPPCLSCPSCPDPPDPLGSFSVFAILAPAEEGRLRGIESKQPPDLDFSSPQVAVFRLYEVFCAGEGCRGFGANKATQSLTGLHSLRRTRTARQPTHASPCLRSSRSGSCGLWRFVCAYSTLLSQLP